MKRLIAEDIRLETNGLYAKILFANDVDKYALRTPKSNIRTVEEETYEIDIILEIPIKT